MSRDETWDNGVQVDTPFDGLIRVSDLCPEPFLCCLVEHDLILTFTITNGCAILVNTTFEEIR